jgi:choline dehydrogenase-like flavoprotein
MISAEKAQKQYDVVIVGSGAGGGQAAYTLTLAGLKCVMLEAGRSYDVVNETPMFQTSDQAPLRGAGTSDKWFGFYDATVGGGWSVPGEPYTSAHKRPEEEFTWWRPRMLGGRTNHWGRISLRNGPYDFKPRSRDGLGIDWPITYDDLEPYYTKVEMLIGVFGTNEGLENTPNSPPGVLLPAPKGRAAELLTQKHGKKLGIPFMPIHRAVLTTHLDWKNLPAKLHPGNVWAQRLCRQSMANRSACFWATDCGRGCNVGANYQSTTVHLPPALASGNLDLISNAHVWKVLLGKDGKASGVLFIDKTTGKEAQVSGRAVVLAAGACETARILLNSGANGSSAGLANSSGSVGKFIMDTTGTGIGGQIPALEGLPPFNEDGAGGAHFYAPWWLYQEQKAGKLNFARGYHIEYGGSRRMPGAGDPVPQELARGSYGTKYKEDARRYFGSFIDFDCRGEMIPNEDSYCELDPAVKDKFGIPVLRFHWKWSDHELNQILHAQQTFRDVIEAMGGKTTPMPKDGYAVIEKPGLIIHEVGGAHCGDDPARSVCNQWCQTWDVKNLFLCDGAPFCSNADKNPTLTLMALAWRTCDHLIDEAKKGNL